MILVDPSHMLLKTSPVPDTLSDTVLSIDNEMRNILESSNRTDHDKAMAYQQALQRYLTKVGQVNRRGSNLIQTNQQKVTTFNQPTQTNNNPDTLPAQSDHNKILKLEDRLLESVPSTLTKKAKLLLDHIKETTDLTWNDRGEIISNGHPVEGSNLQDLVHETVRARKLQGDPPKGWNKFSSLLRASNVPLDLIGNKSRWNIVSDEPIENVKTPVSLVKTPVSHPHSKERKSRSDQRTTSKIREGVKSKSQNRLSIRKRKTPLFWEDYVPQDGGYPKK